MRWLLTGRVGHDDPLAVRQTVLDIDVTTEQRHENRALAPTMRRVDLPSRRGQTRRSRRMTDDKGTSYPGTWCRLTGRQIRAR